jgi:hypothetical protein
MEAMVDAVVKKAFDGVPDGEVMPRRFEVGEVVKGELAVIAVREGWAAKPKAKAPDAPPPP